MVGGWLLLLLGSGYLTLLFAFDIRSADFGILYQTGREIMAQGQVPWLDRFSHTATDRVWIEHRWLFAVVLYLLIRGVGVAGFIVAKAGLVLGIFLAAAWALPRRSPFHLWLGLLLALLAAPLLTDWFVERAQLVSYVALPLEWALLQRLMRPRARGWLLLLLLVQLIWANAHGSFPLGAVVAEVWWLGTLLREGRRLLRRDRCWLAVVPLLLLLVSLLNPYGLTALRNALDHTLLAGPMQARMAEWMAPDLVELAMSPGTGGPMLLLFLALGAGAGLRAWWRDGWRISPDLLLLLLLAGMALHSSRFIPLFLIGGLFLLPGWLEPRPAVPPAPVSLPGERTAVPATFSPGTTRRERLLLLLLALPVLPLQVATWTRPELGWHLEERILQKPGPALAFLAREQIRGKLFNSYDLANSVIQELHPALPVYIDGRFPLYEPDINAEYFRILAEPVWGATRLEQRGIEVVLVDHRPPELRSLVRQLLASGGWGLVFFDQAHLVLVRDVPARAELLRRTRFHLLRPWPTTEPGFPPPDAVTAAAHRAELVRLEELLGPGSGYPPFQAALLELQLGQVRRAGQLLLESLARDPTGLGPRLLLADLSLATGQRAAAQQLYEEVLALDPDHPRARQALEQLRE